MKKEVIKLKQIKVGVLGFGTVGASVIKLLTEHRDKFQDKHGIDFILTEISVRDLKKKRSVSLDTSIKVCDSPIDVVNSSNVDIVVEVIGGTDTAYQCVKLALQNKKPVVTANKALIATYGEELFNIAKEQNVSLLFEASVGGGIPIIKSLREGLASNNILSIRGIINGTSNYILTKMSQESVDYRDALSSAQNLGYAEADPSSDVCGYDAQFKLAIMSSLAYGVKLSTEGIYCEGIDKIESFDIKISESLGYTIKHLCIAQAITDNKILLRVHPVLLKNNNLLAQVNGVMNAVSITGDSVGDTLFYGPGAGGGATASAIVADIIDTVKISNNSSNFAFGYANKNIDVELLNIGELVSSYYIRFNASDTSGVLAKVTNVLAEEGISVETFIQNCKFREDSVVPLVLIIHPAKEKNVQGAVGKLQALDEIKGSIQLIRIEGEG